jgi:hypothetical protein
MSVSLSGLDLSFLNKSRPCKPGRYRIDPETGEAIPAHIHARKYARKPNRSNAVPLPMFVPDVDVAYGGSWKSIIDGTEISSRSNWREHNKRNGVVDIGDKYWSKDGDDIKTTEEIMGYDPSLIGHQDFTWKK